MSRQSDVHDRPPGRRVTVPARGGAGKAVHDETITVELRFGSRDALLDAPSLMEPAHFD